MDVDSVSDSNGSPKAQGKSSSATSKASETSSRLMQYHGTLLPKGFPPLPADWISEWETFPASDGALQLFGVLHHPEKWSGPRAVVVVHGFGEHGGRYLHVPHYLRDATDAVY